MRSTEHRINPFLPLLQFAVLAIILIACGSLPEESTSLGPENESDGVERLAFLDMPSLEAVVPPCITYPGSSVDPCERRDSWPHHQPNIETTVQLPDIFPTLRETIVLRDRPRDMPHFIVRATVVPQTIRCGNSDFRLFLSSSYDRWFPEGTSRGQPYCFVDIAVNEYLVGGGPTRLTVNTRVRPAGLLPDDPDCDAVCLEQGVRLVRSTDIEGFEWIFSLGGPSDLGALA